jgi:hypothetical protein
MSGPAQHSTHLPEPSGPTDERFVYSLTEEGKRVLEEHQATTGEQLHIPSARVSEILEATERETLRRRRAEAMANGRRLGTISYRMMGEKQRPLLRLSGSWLNEAGFPLGQHFEITVHDRQLIIDAV